MGRGTAGWWVVVGACVLALGLGSGSTAHAAWSAPTELGPLTDAGAFQAAAGPDGTEAVAWVAPVGYDYQLEVSIRPPGGTFADPVALGGDAGTNARTPKVAVGSHGEVAVLWSDERDGGGIAAAVRPSGGAFGDPVHLSSDTSDIPLGVGFAGTGSLTALWTNRTAISQAIRTADGTWGSSQGLDISPATGVTSARVIFGSAGAVVVGWQDSAGGYVAERRPGSTTFNATQELNGQGIAPDSLGVDDAGRGVAIWSAGATPWYAESTDGTFADPQPFADAIDPVALARGEDGRTLFACDCYASGSSGSDPPHLQAWSATPDGPIGSLVDEGPLFAEGRLAVRFGSDGEAYLAWVGEDATTGMSSIGVASRAPDGTWSGPHTVSGTDGRYMTPSLSAGGPGTALVAWPEDPHRQLSWTLAVSTYSPGPDAPPPPPPAIPAQPAPLDHTETYGVDAARTSDVAFADDAPPFQRAWSASTGFANTYAAVGDGRVYSISRSPDDGTLQATAYDVTTGDPVWSAPLAAAGEVAQDAVLAYGSGTVVVDTQVQKNSYVYPVAEAFSSATGTLLWRTPLPASQLTPPIVDGNQVIAETESPGDDITALDLADGSVVWDRQGLWAGVPTVAGGRVDAAAAEGMAVGLDRSTGAISWSHDEGGSGAGKFTSAYDGGWLWSDNGGGWFGGRVYDATTGQVVRRFHGVTPALAGDEAYTVDGGRLTALGKRSLSTDWSSDVPGTGSSEPLVVGDSVLVASADGTLHAVDRSTGVEQWSGAAGNSLADSLHRPLPLPVALAAGSGYVVVPTASGLVAFKGSPPPVRPAPTPAPTATGASPSESPAPGSSVPGSPVSRASTTTASHHARLAWATCRTRVPRGRAVLVSCRLTGRGGGPVRVVLWRGRRFVRGVTVRVRRGAISARLALPARHRRGRYTLSVKLRGRRLSLPVR